MAGQATALEEGRAAYAGARWSDAYQRLVEADAETPLGADDLELLARSAYMLGEDDIYVAALERAYRLHFEAGRTGAAVGCTWWIGHNHLFHGRPAHADGWFATLAPKLQAYVIGFDDANADITDYRGFGELSLIFGKRNGLQLRTTARIGDDWDKGSLQLDLSYPIGPLVGNNLDLYLHAQYFNGFGESLLQYDESTSIFRVGLSIVR